MSKIGTSSASWNTDEVKEYSSLFEDIIEVFNEEQNKIRQGGGAIAIEKQHQKGRLTVRERIQHLIDPQTDFFEFGIYAAYGMYEEYKSPAASGSIIGTGQIKGQECMIVANDATVKAGAYFEVTLKKTLRAQQIALENNLPIIVFDMNKPGNLIKLVEGEKIGTLIY